jgi:hypothetical protein
MGGNSTFPSAPRGLGKAGKALWKSVQNDDLELRPDEIAVLTEAAATRDVIASLAEATAREPAIVEGSKGQVIVHPGLQELRQQRALLASLLRQVGIPYPDEDGWDGLSPSQRGRKAAAKRWGH